MRRARDMALLSHLHGLALLLLNRLCLVNESYIKSWVWERHLTLHALHLSLGDDTIHKSLRRPEAILHALVGHLRG